MAHHLEQCCLGLESSKISERKKSADALKELMEDNVVLRLLNNTESRMNWDFVIEHVHNFLKKEALKIREDESRNTLTRSAKRANGDLLMIIINKATSRGSQLDISKLLSFTLEFFNSRLLKEYFSGPYLNVLKNVLSVQRHYGLIESGDWIDLLNNLKPLLSFKEIKSYECLELIFQWGPLHSLSNTKLRQEVEFVTEIAKKVNNSSSRYILELNLQLLLKFSNQIVEDSRVACCKLGEELFSNLIQIYQNQVYNTRLLVLEFLFLQVRIHHPGGSTEGSVSAYAYSWPEWRKFLRSMYSVLYDDITNKIILKNNPTTISLLNNNSMNFTTLPKIFLDLVVEVFKQVYSDSNSLLETSVNMSDETQPLSKKRKVEVGIPAVIDIIQQEKNWMWISVLSNLLRKYPTLLTPHDYVNLLSVLSTLQSECKSSNIRYHLYRCLATLITVENSIKLSFYSEKVTSLWTLVSESTLRAVGLNENEEQTHKLLQKLITNQKSLNSVQLFKTYFSQVLNVSKHSLCTLNLACAYFGLPNSISNETREDNKKILMRWILSTSNKKGNTMGSTTFYSEDVTATTLLFLTFKQWPISNTIPQKGTYKNENTESVEYIYSVTSFDSQLILSSDVENKQKAKEDDLNNNEKVHVSQSQTLAELFEMIQELSTTFLKSSSQDFKAVEDLINIATFLANFLSLLVTYDLLSLDDHVLVPTMNLVFEKWCHLFCNLIVKIKEKNKHLMIEIFKQIIKMLTTNLHPLLHTMIRKQFSVDMIRELFDLLNKKENENEDLMDDDQTHRLDELSSSALDVLCCYCCIPSVDCNFELPQQVLKVLSKPEFDPDIASDYQMAMTFLCSLKNYPHGTLSDDILGMILKNIQNICQQHYTNYTTALNILNILYGLLPHVALSCNDELQENTVTLLCPFYTNRERYGPKVSIALVNCMGQLAKVDADIQWSKWPEIDILDIPAEITQFLDCDNQSVRLAAIRNLHIIFSMPCENQFQLQRQKKVFKSVCLKSLEVFNVTGRLSDERQIDEIVTRTASALHTYATLMISNGVFRQKSLFALLELVNTKKLNHDSTKNVLEMVAQKLNIANAQVFLESNLSYLISEWYCRGYNLKDFPFFLLNCSSEINFYITYTNLVFPMLFVTDSLLLKQICEHHQKVLEDVVKDCFPHIASHCLLVESSEMYDPTFITQKEIEFKNKCKEKFMVILQSETYNDLITNKLDEVIHHLLKYCFDPQNFNEKFSVCCILPEQKFPTFSVEIVKSTLKCMEKYLNNQSLIVYCIQNAPEKLQKMILDTFATVYKVQSTEEKMIEFHRCTIIIDLLIPFLKESDGLTMYLIRTISYMLIHLISKDYECDSVLNLICCRYFHKFLSQILPENYKLIQVFLVTFVSILIPIAKCDSKISLECTNLLHLLIINHENTLSKAIELLDPFPQEDKFLEMQKVYNRVRKDKGFKLEGEITRFLHTSILMGSTGNRIEGLKHLKIELATKKLELKEMYQKLLDLKGFSEDCEKSILHKLICVLVKLSLSSDANESILATRCLGELGSADLSTTILQVEHKYDTELDNPFELVTGCITSLLIKYIVDFDIDVVQMASEALYQVLDCKEGKSILTSSINYENGPINQGYIFPFVSSRKIRTDSSYSLKSNFVQLVNQDSLWCPRNVTLHSAWITKLVCTILDTFTDKCYLSFLVTICKAKVEFAEYILPLIVYLTLFSGHSEIIFFQMRQFFLTHWNLTIQGCENQDIIAVNKVSVQCMLNVVHFIRTQKNVQASNRMTHGLTLNYLHVAQAAQFCTAHFTALLYVELWFQERITELISNNAFFSVSNLTPLEIIIQNEELDIQQTVRNILKQSYKKVGELDALHACETIGILNSNLRIERFEHLQQWDQVALHYDIKVSQGDPSMTGKLLEALKSCGIFQLPLNYNNTTVEPQFECAWRLSQWNLNKTEMKTVNNIEAYKYFALKSIHDNDVTSFNNEIAGTRSCVVDFLRHASLESSKNLYEALSHFQAITELEDFYEAKKNENFDVLLNKWKIQDDINRNEFQYLEPIRAQRIVMVGDLVTSGQENLKDSLIEMYLNLANLARMENKHNIANRTLGTLVYIPDIPSEIKNRIMMEEAQLCWIDDKTTARHILRNVINNSPSPRLHAAALKLFGTWMVETCSENPCTIISSYFTYSINILKDLPKNETDIQNLCDTYDILARFADSNYQQVISYIKSSIFDRKVQNMERSKATASNIRKQLKRGAKLLQDESRAISLHERQSKIDENEINSTYKEKEMYATLAMKFYISTLINCDANNVRMFRILSLWLENRNNTEVVQLINTNLLKIPTYKFIPVLPQFIPHVTNNSEDSFGTKINMVIEKCAEEHPHHTLPIIMALAHSNEDKNYYDSTTNTASNEVRVEGAKNIIEKLKDNDTLNRLIFKMSDLSHALMELAYLDSDTCKPDRSKCLIIADKFKITKIKNFCDVLLPTCTLQIRKDCNYRNIIGIYHFQKKFELVGGVNAPKRISCMGTDGKLRSQLVKGKDDLRQDAVMQQVFNIMNSFLKSNKQTSKLLIRTYKVVPLSQRSGILEWVENSMPIGEYLVGKDKKKGAHEIYNPTDFTPDKCRNEYKNTARLSNAKKLAVYTELCKKFRPVFHKFFEASFVLPAVWYERRRAYMYSVATSSMCGYILGLGDRHVQNILIDKNTAEVIHIDFGIAFEQGLVLPTPETVPFRLTRDIEAGMGVCGIEGVFRKSCEKTLEVLRNNSETITTIVEVLLYDPLYAWTVTPAEAYSRQLTNETDTTNHPLEFSDQDLTSANTTADRALLRLRQKLQGTAEGGSTSIEGQVEKLLQQARDPSNLCRLFQGWQPYL